MQKSKIHWGTVKADPRFKQLHRDKNRFLWRLMLFALIYFFLLADCHGLLSRYFKNQNLGRG